MKAQKVGKMAIFSVGAVLFSAHAGGGFATGNQANTYYVGIGWTGIVSAIIAMLLLILTMREAMVMYNQRNLTSAKELFENLYHPFDKLEILFEIFFNIMVLMAVAAAISGAASALQQYFGFNYYACVVAVNNFWSQRSSYGKYIYGYGYFGNSHCYLWYGNHERSKYWGYFSK